MDAKLKKKREDEEKMLFITKPTHLMYEDL